MLDYAHSGGARVDIKSEDGELDCNSGAFGRRIISRPNGRSMRIRDAAADCKAEPGAISLRRYKRLKNLRQ